MNRTIRDNEFYSLLSELEHSPAIARMGHFSQHKGNTTLQHCKNVAECSYRLSRRLHMDVNVRAMTRGAMLHDYYLYNTRDMTISSYRHGVSHPRTALENASRFFRLDEKEQNIILSHMWPLTLTALPRSREALLVSVADKICAVVEMAGRKDIYRKKLAGTVRRLPAHIPV